MQRHRRGLCDLPQLSFADSRTTRQMPRQIAQSQRQEEAPRMGATAAEYGRWHSVPHLPYQRETDAQPPAS